MLRVERESDVRRFGTFEVDLRARELRKGGIRIRLQDQPFEILAMMLDRPGELVTREELRQRLWPFEPLWRDKRYNDLMAQLAIPASRR